LFGGQDDPRDESTFTLNPWLRPLFENYTLLDWDDRLALGAKQFAKWLQAFYATHAAPHPMKVATLMQLCGSEAKDLNDFRRDLRAALNELAGRKLIRSWRIDAADLVHVAVAPSPSQTRHLGRQGT